MNLTQNEPGSSALYPTYTRSEFTFERGEGAWLITTEGRRVLDCAAGIAVNVLGHGHPHLVNALKAQAEKLWQVSNLYRIPEQERLAQRLATLTFADKVFFTNSGAEAIEAAIKTARRHFHDIGKPERYRLITFEGAFHGRTLATIAAGGQTKYLQGFGPVAPGFDQVPFGDIDAVRAAIGPETAGFLIEPIQGEGGIRALTAADLRALRALADDNDLLLVLDEVQCGVGRTGKLFAYEWSGIAPDIMAIAKGLGGGFPVGACLARADVAEAMVPGTHGTTFGGNPLAMAVGNAVIDVVSAPTFLAEVVQKGLLFKQGLARLIDAYPDVFSDIRGVGLMLGLQCRVPTVEVLAACRKADLMAVSAGQNVLRLLPPLTISEAEISMAIDRIDMAARAIRATYAGANYRAAE